MGTSPEKTGRGGTRKRWRPWVWALPLVGVVACEQTEPTSVSGDLIPLIPTTVEVVLPWAAFGDSVAIYGGFGTTSELFALQVAEDYRGELDARSLIRFNPFPATASVRDSTGTVRTDSSWTYVGGRVVARMDTIRSKVEGPVELAVGWIAEDWEERTATWEFLVDTAGDQRAWAEPGAGPVTPLVTATWDPAAGDSIIFALDSASMAVLNDTTAGPRKSVRMDMLTVGARVEVIDVDLRIDGIPSSNPDTLVVLNSVPRNSSFVYAPFPDPPPDGIRAGGAPSWRTVLVVDIPTVLNGPATLCDRVGCPFEVTPERLNHASLILTSRASAPAAFQPSDSLILDVRPVLVPDRLPKSPLGPSFLGLGGRRIDPAAFGEEAGVQIPITVTEFVRGLVDPERRDQLPNQLALLSLLEPFTLGFGDFDGPGDLGEPVLRLILTASDPVEIR